MKNFKEIANNYLPLPFKSLRLPNKSYQLPLSDRSSPVPLILRGRWDKSALETAQKIANAGEIDWDNLRQIVNKEALAPLFSRILRNQDWVEASVKKEWDRAYQQNACRNTLLFRELDVVLQKLATVGVDVIVLKGAALAETIYRDIALRPMSDLDLLIHAQDLPITREVLGSLGYKSIFVEMQTGFTEEFRNEEVHFKSGLVDIYVDLHWRLISPVYYQRTILSDWFWETALPAKIAGTKALVLGKEAQLLYLCAHLMLHHGGKNLLWLHDIAEAIAFEGEKLDWEKILTQAQVYNLVLSVQQILLRVADEWQIEIPEKVRSQLRDLHPSSEEVRTYLWQHQTMALRLFADLAATKNWGTKLRIAWDTLFPSFAYMQQRYRIPHPLLVPFYYPYRLLRGLRRIQNNEST